jgi:molecular chaperone GrpE
MKENNKKQKSTSADPKDLRIVELEGKIKELAFTIDEVEDEKLEVHNKLMKALADYQNLEKSIDIRLEQRLAQLKMKVAEDIIPIIDDLYFGEKAKDQIVMDENAEAWAVGLLGSADKMKKAIAELGIEMMDVKIGDQFNSNIHEAIAVVPEGGDENSIIEIIQPGYIMGELVVRASRVVVCKKQ